MKNLRDKFLTSNKDGIIFGSINKYDLRETTFIEPELTIQKYYNGKISNFDEKIKMVCAEINKLIPLKKCFCSPNSQRLKNK